MRPPVIATLVLLFGILAAIPFRRQGQPDADANAPASSTAIPHSAPLAVTRPVETRRQAASPLQVTADPEQTARELQDQLPKVESAPTVQPQAIERFHSSYADTAIELVDPPIALDRWNEEEKVVERYDPVAIPDTLLAEGQTPTARVREPDAVPAFETPAELTAVRHKKESPLAASVGPDALPSAGYGWQQTSLKAGFVDGPPKIEAEEIPAPRATRPGDRLTPVAQHPAPRPESRGMEAIAETRPQPKPRKRYFIREPALDSSISR